jgi:predicted transglutaminase-like cysteine proteinase
MNFSIFLQAIAPFTGGFGQGLAPIVLAHGRRPSMTKPRSIALLSAALALASALVLPTVSLGASPAPLGFQLMCLQHPAECRGGGSAEVRLTETMLAAIRRINNQVNHTIEPRNDRGGDAWTIGASAGDCEDYVLSKRRALIRSGLPASALRIAHVQTRSGLDHAVLIVKTHTADLVLDNLVPNVTRLENTSYRVLGTSGADPMVWTN